MCSSDLQVFTLHRFIACPHCHPTPHQRSSRSLRELAILMTALPDIRRPLLRLRDPAQLLHSQGADRPRRPGQARAAKAPRGFDSLSLASPQSDPDLEHLCALIARERTGTSIPRTLSRRTRSRTTLAARAGGPSWTGRTSHGCPSAPSCRGTR